MLEISVHNQRIGFFLLIVLSALSFLTLCEEYEHTTGSKKREKMGKTFLNEGTRRAEKYHDNPNQSEDSSPFSSDDSPHDTSKKMESTFKQILDFSQADSITREAIIHTSLLTRGPQESPSMTNGMKQLLSSDSEEKKSIVHSPSLLLKGGSAPSSDLNDDSSNNEEENNNGNHNHNSNHNNNNNKYYIPDYSLKTGSKKELQEKTNNLEQELEKQKTFTNDARQEKVQAEKKITC